VNRMFRLNSGRWRANAIPVIVLGAASSISEGIRS
jgi:hypothetical protein